MFHTPTTLQIAFRIEPSIFCMCCGLPAAHEHLLNMGVVTTRRTGGDGLTRVDMRDMPILMVTTIFVLQAQPTL